MRELADAARIKRFMHALAVAAPQEGTCYLVGGGTAVLLGWRESTIDVDIGSILSRTRCFVRCPRSRTSSRLTSSSPRRGTSSRFPPAGRTRSPSVGREGRLTFKHFDLYSQALAKLERGHTQDLEDARVMLKRGLVEVDRLRSAFDEIEPQLYRFPAIDPADYRRVDEFLG